MFHSKKFNPIEIWLIKDQLSFYTRESLTVTVHFYSEVNFVQTLFNTVTQVVLLYPRGFRVVIRQKQQYYTAGSNHQLAENQLTMTQQTVINWITRLFMANLAMFLCLLHRLFSQAENSSS